MAFGIKKLMGRELTDEEKAEIRLWVIAHPESTIDEAVLFFEDRFKTSITEMCIMRRVLEAERESWK